MSEQRSCCVVSRVQGGVGVYLLHECAHSCFAAQGLAFNLSSMASLDITTTWGKAMSTGTAFVMSE